MRVTAAERRIWSVTSLIAYIVCIAMPIWYNAVRIPRVALPLAQIDSLASALAQPLAAALPSTITAYVVCPGPSYPCLEFRQLSAFAQQLGLAVLAEAGLSGEQAPLVVRVLHDAPGSCSASSWTSPGEAARRVSRASSSSSCSSGSSSCSSGSPGGGGTACLDLVSSADLHRVVTGGADREFDDWAAEQLAGQDRPGNYHVFIVPDPWLAATELPFGSVGRRRVALVRHPTVHGPTHGSVVRLVALLAAPAFVSGLGPPASATSRSDPESDPDEDQPLPLNAAAQLHLSFSLCNAHPSPYDGDGRGGGGGGGKGGDAADAAAAAAFIWSFPKFEAQFASPLKQVLSPAARMTVSSQVLYFTPGRVNGTWDQRRRAFVLPYDQLPFFVDNAWPLDPGRTGLPASAAGGTGDAPYDTTVVAAGSRYIAVGEVMALPPPQAGAPGRAAGEAAAVAALPHLLPPPAAASLPPSVLNFVLYSPPPRQRPLLLLGPDGAPAPANSFRVPGWGMLQVLNQVPEPGAITAQVSREALEAFAVELVAQLRALLGLGPARRRLLRLVAAGNASNSGGAGGAASTANNAAVGRVSVVSALTTGLAPWEVDALLRRRVRQDAAAACATLAALARLLRQVPTLAVPGHVGALVRDAAAALRRTLELAAQGRYEEASRSAQWARAGAEAAFSDPALSSRLNVPDSHLVGVYLPFCLPAAVPLLQAMLQEIKRRRRKKESAAASPPALSERTANGKEGKAVGSGSGPGCGPGTPVLETDAAAGGGAGLLM